MDEKHPESSPIHVQTVVPKLAEHNFHPVILSKLTSDLVRKCTLQTEDADGPSGLDTLK